MADENPDLVQRLEADLEEAKTALEAIPAKVETAVDAKLATIHQHIDAFKEDVRANVSALIPTTAHNTLMALAETLRTKIASLF